MAEIKHTKQERDAFRDWLDEQWGWFRAAIHLQDLAFRRKEWWESEYYPKWVASGGGIPGPEVKPPEVKPSLEGGLPGTISFRDQEIPIQDWASMIYEEEGGRPVTIYMPIISPEWFKPEYLQEIGNAIYSNLYSQAELETTFNKLSPEEIWALRIDPTEFWTALSDFSMRGYTAQKLGVPLEELSMMPGVENLLTQSLTNILSGTAFDLEGLISQATKIKESIPSLTQFMNLGLTERDITRPQGIRDWLEDWARQVIDPRYNEDLERGWQVELARLVGERNLPAGLSYISGLSESARAGAYASVIQFPRWERETGRYIAKYLETPGNLEIWEQALEAAKLAAGKAAGEVIPGTAAPESVYVTTLGKELEKTGLVGETGGVPQFWHEKALRRQQELEWERLAQEAREEARLAPTRRRGRVVGI